MADRSLLLAYNPGLVTATDRQAGLLEVSRAPFPEMAGRPDLYTDDFTTDLEAYVDARAFGGGYFGGCYPHGADPSALVLGVDYAGRGPGRVGGDGGPGWLFGGAPDDPADPGDDSFSGDSDVGDGAEPYGPALSEGDEGDTGAGRPVGGYSSSDGEDASDGEEASGDAADAHRGGGIMALLRPGAGPPDALTEHADDAWLVGGGEGLMGLLRPAGPTYGARALADGRLVDDSGW